MFHIITVLILVKDHLRLRYGNGRKCRIIEGEEAVDGNVLVRWVRFIGVLMVSFIVTWACFSPCPATIIILRFTITLMFCLFYLTLISYLTIIFYFTFIYTLTFILVNFSILNYNLYLTKFPFSKPQFIN